jgi:hypothetical protein
MTIPTFDEYLASLTNLSEARDPTVLTAEGAIVAAAGAALSALSHVDRPMLAALIEGHPEYVPTLGLSVGLSQESLKNTLRHHLGTSGWIKLAQEAPMSIVNMLDEQFDLVRLIGKQRLRGYEFADVLVARAGTRATAAQAGARGRRIEDEIEDVARGLGLPYQTRTRFTGRAGRDAPCDLAIPSGGAGAQIAVAAKGFNSTGSKLSAALQEVKDMAEVRKPTQFVMAIIDGIGWKGRQSDLHQLYDLWTDGTIDGMYTLATLGQFRLDLEGAALRLGIL